ncbi:hypothetical protein OROGR_018452 [Orobanche gracilis]
MHIMQSFSKGVIVGPIAGLILLLGNLGVILGLFQEELDWNEMLIKRYIGREPFFGMFGYGDLFHVCNKLDLFTTLKALGFLGIFFMFCGT